MSEDELSLLASLIEEKVADQLQIFNENLESLIDRKLEPIKDDIAELNDDMKVVKPAVVATTEELRNLDKAVGNVELKLHDTKTIAFSAYSQAAKHEKAIAKLQTNAT